MANNNPFDINNMNDILCVGATKLGVLSTLVMAEYWPDKRFVIAGSPAAINRWQAQNLRVFEPGLPGLLAARTAPPPNGNVTFQPMVLIQMADFDMIFVATEVNTKKRGIGANKRLDLSPLDQVLRNIITHVQQHKIVIIKSTVPHDMRRVVANIINDVSVGNDQARDFPIFWVPEFYSAGTALANIRQPHRVVISRCNGDINMDVVAGFYLQTQVLWVNNQNILLYENLGSAAIGAMGVNVMLAFKATLMEIVSRFCDSLTGVDATEVRNIIRSDPRVGEEFFDITAGFGGGALLRDLRYFKHLAELSNDKITGDLISKVIKSNERYKEEFVAQMLHHMNSLEQKVVVILGFSYKPNTSEVDNSAAIHICQKLYLEKARIRIHDPKAIADDIRACFSPVCTQGNNPKIAVHQLMNNQLWHGASAICFLQNSEEFNALDFDQLYPTFAQQSVFLFDTCGALQPHLPAIQHFNQVNNNSLYKIKIRGHHGLL